MKVLGNACEVSVFLVLMTVATLGMFRKKCTSTLIFFRMGEDEYNITPAMILKCLTLASNSASSLLLRLATTIMLQHLALLIDLVKSGLYKKEKEEIYRENESTQRTKKKRKKERRKKRKGEEKEKRTLHVDATTPS